jgi:hypothetical protein
MDGWVDGWMDGWMDGYVGGWMNGYMGGSVYGWICKWMDLWMDGCSHAYMYVCMCVCVCVCMYVCMYVRVSVYDCMCIYIYICTLCLCLFIILRQCIDWWGYVAPDEIRWDNYKLWIGRDVEGNTQSWYILRWFSIIILEVLRKSMRTYSQDCQPSRVFETDVSRMRTGCFSVRGVFMQNNYEFSVSLPILYSSFGFINSTNKTP